MTSIPNNYYRISVKALVLNEEKKFLLAREFDGRWELLGGGLDFGEDAHTCLRREVREETGINVTFVADKPSYFYTDKHRKYDQIAHIVYEVCLENLDFRRTDECTELRFFTKEEALKENLLPHVKIFLSVFNPDNH